LPYSTALEYVTHAAGSRICLSKRL
jgi:hypothetical protein